MQAFRTEPPNPTISLDIDSRHDSRSYGREACSGEESEHRCQQRRSRSMEQDEGAEEFQEPAGRESRRCCGALRKTEIISACKAEKSPSKPVPASKPVPKSRKKTGTGRFQ